MGIVVERVTKRFGDFTALDDVSIDVESGSLTALLGPSGSGKSTLLRVIAGLEAPDAGTVVIDGVDRTGVAPRHRGVGFVFQHYAAFRHMTVFENIAFGLRVRRVPRREVRNRVHDLIGLVQLGGMAERYPHQLSGGQRQRMALARALAVEPSVLLLDEPFGALDARVRRELRAWLRRLHDEVHVTTVLVTHDQEEAMEVSDTIAVMDHSRIEQVAGPRDLYERPATDFVMGFVGPVAVLDGRRVRPHQIALDTTGVDGSLPATVRRVVHLGFEVRVELDAEGHGDELWVQLSRHDPLVSTLEPGTPVWARPLPALDEDDAEEADRLRVRA